MSSDPLARFSIKERLRSSDNSPSAKARPDSRMSPHHQVLAPEHYNYFLSSIQKELQHENHTLRKIKNTLDHYRNAQAAKAKIKNSYEFSHHALPKKKRKSTIFKSRSKFTSTAPLHENNCSTKPYQNSLSGNRSNRQALSSAKSSTSFLRTPQRTFYDWRDQEGQKWQGEKGRKSWTAVKKGGIFEVTGSRPVWGSFQSYRACYTNAFRSVI